MLAQSQENNWLFGFWNHVEFENGTIPIVYPEDPIYATEGSASISNAAGQLQFYTNGLLVFDRLGGVMPGPNTLYGNDSDGKHYAQDEVYTYVLRYGLPNGDREEVYGSVIILR